MMYYEVILFDGRIFLFLDPLETFTGIINNMIPMIIDGDDYYRMDVKEVKRISYAWGYRLNEARA